MSKKPVMLMILDGFGIAAKSKGNAVSIAKKPNIDKLLKEYPHTELQASGMAVGLPEGQMGNSEVGHLNIGAGRIVYQELTRITKSIEDGDFFKNEALLKAMKNAKENNSALHIMGLLSDGGVHSHINHLKGLLEFAKKEGLTKVYVHAFMDGRDVPPSSGLDYILQTENMMKEIGVGKIATVSGRYYAMDRDNRWERVELAYNALVLGKGNTATSATSAIENSYKDQKTDEFVVPCVLLEDGKPTATISNNDSVIFFNFRPDRAREITRAINDQDFTGFKRDNLNLVFVTMTQYDKTLEGVNVAFKPQTLVNTLGEYVSSKGLKQLRIAETEKYAHVTFFFNGGREKPYKGEDRILIPSPKVETYDMKPEMSANEICDNVCKAIDDEKYDAIILNFANPDMVGHTGNMEAAEKAVEMVDKCIGRIITEIGKHNGQLLITADHGNCEQMIDYKTGEPFTSHTTNPVPLILYGRNDVKLKNGRLCDLAPTLLDLMGLEKPEEMTGESLLVRE